MIITEISEAMANGLPASGAADFWFAAWILCWFAFFQTFGGRRSAQRSRHLQQSRYHMRVMTRREPAAWRVDA